jgi:hypothetical protein
MTNDTNLPRLPVPLRMIVSGGQTGADRAGLDFAIEHEIPHAGWCPKGRKAEDGVIPTCYRLRETPSANYIQRTEWNIRDSDGTVIFALEPVLTGGTRKTAEFARNLGKPLLVVTPADSDAATRSLCRWIIANSIQTLNVAGPRASKEPEIHGFALGILRRTLGG